MLLAAIATGLVILLVCACQSQAQTKPDLISPAFPPGAQIPSQFTCSGEDKSPRLEWKGLPPSAKSLALVMEDPDASRGTFIHWVIYNLSPNLPGLAENQPKSATTPDGARQGANSFGHYGYNGPCPPPGKPHHYHFRLLALDGPLNLDPGASASEVEAAARGHTVASAELVGIFGR